MYKDISKDTQKVYEITKPGEYVFYFENRTGELTFDIFCENANIAIYGLYRGTSNENFNLHITQNHIAPNSKSQSIIKSVLNNKSKFNFTGIIHIQKKATHSIAHLTNNNLLLSKFSKVVTSPSLEVFPNKVECTHDTTTTPLQQNQLEYLQARGLSKNDAKLLLINGFINEIVCHQKLQRD